MDKLISIFKKHSGYARMKDIKETGIHTRNISKALFDGTIEKIKPGLYKLIDYPWDEHSSFFDICQSKNSAVICLSSALEYYGLTTFIPGEITVAVPHNTDKFQLDYPPIRVFYFSDNFYKVGIRKINIGKGVFKIYNQEKTIADMFRYRKKLGEDIALEGLKNYLKQKDANINKLREYAEICQVKTTMFPYLKALVS